MGWFTRSSTIEAEAEQGRLLAVAVDVELKAAAAKDGESSRPPTFEAIAYTGAPMKLAGWKYPVIVALAGIEAAGDQLPVLRSHDDNRVVGHTNEVSISEKGVRVSGVISGTGADAQEIVNNARNGYRWKLSQGGNPIGSAEFLPPGKSATINGHAIQGPHFVVRRAMLNEISFLPRGADGKTSAAIAAQHEDGTMSTDTISTDDLKQIRALTRDLRGTVDDKQLDAWEDSAIEGSMTVAELQAKAIDVLKDKAKLRGIEASMEYPCLGGDNGSAIRSGGRSRSMTPGVDLLTCAFASRIDQALAVKVWGEQTVEAARPYASLTMQDFFRAAMRIEGRDAPANPDRLIQAAASMISLPEILTDAPRRLLEEQLRNAAPTWAGIARPREAKDFRTHRSVRLQDDRGLQKLPKDGEIEHTTLSEQTYDWKIDTYAKQVQITRQDFINDDLGAFADIAEIFTNDALQSIGDVFYEVLNAGLAADFFSTESGNLLEEGSELSEESLALAVRTLREMRDVKGRLLNLVPGVLLVPPALEVTGRKLLNSEYMMPMDGPTGNALAGIARLEVEGRIGTAGGGNDARWYLFAQQRGAMQVAFLQSTTPRPIVEFFPFNTNIDNVVAGWRVILDHGSARGDFRLAIMATGEPEST